jgi:hypothetical protein
LKLKCFSLLRILTSFYLKRLLDPFFFFLFFLSFFNKFSLSSFFYASSLEDLGVLMIFEEKINSSKKIQMEWHGHDCGYTGGGRIF